MPGSILSGYGILGYYPLDPNNFAAKHPQFIKEFDKKLFLDPGYPEVRSHVVDVIAEVARNYEVDAILLDDYFLSLSC